MKRTLFALAVLGFWIFMTTQLVQREFFQPSAVTSAYEVLPLDLDVREEYNTVLLGNERIGFNFNLLEPKKEKNETYFQLRHQTYLSFLFLGQQREMLVRGKAQLSPALTVQSFETQISSSGYWTKISGNVTGGQMHVTIEADQGDPVKKDIPLKKPVFYSEALRFLWTPDNLKVGKKGSLDAWNPLLGNFQTVQFEVLKKTRIDYQGKPADVFETRVSTGGMETKAWVNPEGIVLKEENATGLSSLKEEGWQIFDAMRKSKTQPPDIPNLFSIASPKTISKPEKLEKLSLKIKSGQEEQSFTISKATLEGLNHTPLPVPLSADIPNSTLNSDAWIQSDDQAVSEKAKAIIDGSSSALEAAQKILNWVHSNISPVPSMSVPQARQVLGVRKGDCNEYSVLFTAMARAVGIPTKMIAGLVYQNGRFFYHAWAEVYLGRWIPVDPTFGQFPADAAHIPLTEGSLEEQVQLVTQFGKIEILDVTAQES